MYSQGLDNENLVNNVGGGTDVNEDNESLNKANSSNPEGGPAAANNGSSTPLTSAKQKKMFFTKKVCGCRSKRVE